MVYYEEKDSLPLISEKEIGSEFPFNNYKYIDNNSLSIIEEMYPINLENSFFDIKNYNKDIMNYFYKEKINKLFINNNTYKEEYIKLFSINGNSNLNTIYYKGLINSILKGEMSFNFSIINDSPQSQNLYSNSNNKNSLIT